MGTQAHGEARAGATKLVAMTDEALDSLEGGLHQWLASEEDTPPPVSDEALAKFSSFSESAAQFALELLEHFVTCEPAHHPEGEPGCECTRLAALASLAAPALGSKTTRRQLQRLPTRGYTIENSTVFGERVETWCLGE